MSDKNIQITYYHIHFPLHVRIWLKLRHWGNHIYWWCHNARCKIRNFSLEESLRRLVNRPHFYWLKCPHCDEITGSMTCFNRIKPSGRYQGKPCVSMEALMCDECRKTHPSPWTISKNAGTCTFTGVIQ